MTTPDLLVLLIPLSFFLVYRQCRAWERKDLRRAIERDPETRLRREMEATR